MRNRVNVQKETHEQEVTSSCTSCRPRRPTIRSPICTRRSKPIVQRIGGTIEKTDNWGRRKLAYEIGRHKEGTYVLEVINGSRRADEGDRSAPRR